MVIKAKSVSNALYEINRIIEAKKDFKGDDWLHFVELIQNINSTTHDFQFPKEKKYLFDFLEKIIIEFDFGLRMRLIDSTLERIYIDGEYILVSIGRTFVKYLLNERGY